MNPNAGIAIPFKPGLSRTDYLFEAVAAVALLATCIVPAVLFRSLPDSIPTHYGINGEADSWGSKTSIFVLPAISTILFIGLSILNRFPHVFNYQVKVTEENAIRLYTKGTRIIRIVKAGVVFLFFGIEWFICHSTDNSHLPVWFLPAVLPIPVLLPIIMAFTLAKNPSSEKQQ
jgi:uncharacterized membrane protein